MKATVDIHPDLAGDAASSEIKALKKKLAASKKLVEKYKYDVTCLNLELDQLKGFKRDAEYLAFAIGEFLENHSPKKEGY